MSDTTKQKSSPKILNIKFPIIKIFNSKSLVNILKFVKELHKRHLYICLLVLFYFKIN